MAEERPGPGPTNHQPLCRNDLILFGGMAAMLILVGVVSYWIEPFRGVVANGVSALIGAGTMYLRGK